MGTIFLLAMSFVTLNASALEAQQSPYDKIAERNLFQLHAPAVVVVDPAPMPPLRKVTLTGITTILETTVAFLTIEGTKAQPVESVMIGERQVLKEIEVKSIDERAGVVRILNGGKAQVLNFEATRSPPMPPNPEPIPVPAPAPGVPVKAEASITPEEQAALIELQRIKYHQEGNSAEALLPATGVDL